MKGIKWITLSLLAGCLLSCDGFKENGGDEAFYYFPEKNMYYDVERQLYLFSLDSGKTWDSLPASSENIPAVLGERKVVSSNTEPVWANNESDRQQYNGKLYNIVNDETLRPAETDYKPASRAKATDKTDNDKKKRPIKKFFDKLFGKKKREGQ